MSRVAALATFFAVSSLSAQEPAPVVAPPPSPPGVSPMAAPVTPPLPGQILEAPAPAVPTSPPVEAPIMAPAPAPLGTPPPMPLNTPATILGKPRAGSSTSTSGQFIVHGDDLSLRSALSSKCEDISRELSTLLHDKKPWSLPIIVLMKSGDAARKESKTASTVISQLSHGGFHIQVNVNLRPDLRPSDLRKEIIRALLAERILREQKEIVAKRNLLLPDWLYLGILEATDYRQRVRPSTLFAAIFKSGRIFGIEEIIEASASDIDDSLSKTIYQTSCCALVLALLDQPDSGMRMAKFLNALASDSRSERELLNQWFPNFAASEASLNKWWALQLATLASPGTAEPLSPLDTIAALEDALTLSYQAAPGETPPTSKRVPAAAAVPRPRPRPVTPRPAHPPSPASDQETVEEKPSLMGRLNPFSRTPSSDDEIAAAIQEAARAEAASVSDLPPAMPAPEPATNTSTGRKPLLNRFFEPEAEPAKPAPRKSATPKKAAPPATPPPATEDEASKLNPMKWFRGGKKESEPAPEANRKKAALSSEADPFIAQILAQGRITAVVLQQTAAEDESAGGKKRFFGLFGKKTAEDDPAVPETPKTVAPKPRTTVAPPTPAPEAAADPAKRQPLRLRLFADKEEPEPTPAPTVPSVPATPSPRPQPSAPARTSSPPPILVPAPALPQPAITPPPALRSQTASDKTALVSIPIEEYAAILKRKDLGQILSRNISILIALQNRGAILFRPIASDYAAAMNDISAGKTKGLDDRLRILRVRTQEALEQSDAVRDLLDVHEANDSPTMSGLFEDYLKLPETIANEMPPRTDAISKYLDALDKEFSKE